MFWHVRSSIDYEEAIHYVGNVESFVTALTRGVPVPTPQIADLCLCMAKTSPHSTRECFDTLWLLHEGLLIDFIPLLNMTVSVWPLQATLTHWNTITAWAHISLLPARWVAYTIALYLDAVLAFDWCGIHVMQACFAGIKRCFKQHIWPHTCTTTQLWYDVLYLVRTAFIKRSSWLSRASGKRRLTLQRWVGT